MATEMQPNHTTRSDDQDVERRLIQHSSGKKKLKYASYGLIIAILIIIVLLVLTIYYATSNESSSSSESASELTEEVDAPFCETETCYNLASDIQRSMNMSIDPCNNFYQYVCGGWQNEYNWELSKNELLTQNDELDVPRKQVFIDAITVSNHLWQQSSVITVKTFFDSCYSSKLELENIQSEQLLQEFMNMVNFSDFNLKNMNLTDIYDVEWDTESSLGFQQATAWMLLRGWDDLFRLFPEGSVGHAWIEQNAEIWLNYNRSEWESKMTETFIDLYQSLFDLTQEQSEFIADLVLDFMDQIAIITTADEAYLYFIFDPTLKNQYIRNMSIDEINDIFGGQIGLLDYKQLMIDTFQCINSECVDNIIYLEPGIQFFRNLTILINQTSPYIVQYWFFTNTLSNYFNYGHNEKSFEQLREEDRRDYCYDHILENFPFVYAYITAERTYSIEKYELALDTTERILIDGVASLISEADWLDDYSLKNSLEKANSMNLFVGITENLKNITFINEYYKDININLTNGFIRNYHLALEFNANNALKAFRGDEVNLVGSWPPILIIQTFWLTSTSAFYQPTPIGETKGNWFCMYVLHKLIEVQLL